MGGYRLPVIKEKWCHCMRRAAKVDENQGEIVKALRDIGCSVQSLAATGKGCPDLLIGYREKKFLDGG